jgi:HlyD family secretion protein
MKKWFILPIIVIVGLVFWLATRKSDATQSLPFTPELEKVTRGNLRVDVSTTGVIEPINKVEIKSKASGLIEEMRIEESDHVKKGDLIARLDQRDTKNSYDQSVAELEVAEAAVKQSQSDFDRKKELYDKGLISTTDFDQAQLALVQAKAAVVSAKVNLDNNDIRLKDTVVRSPIDGVILTKDVEVGQIISSGISSVSGGTLIATVADMKQVYVKADVDEVDIGQIESGMRAFAVADAFPNEQFVGEVIRIAAQAQVTQNVTSFEVTIKVDNPTGKLKAGMNVSVEILVADKRNVLLVSNEAIMSQKELRQELAKIRIALGTPEGEKGQRKNLPGQAGGERQLGQLGNRPNKQSDDESANLRRGVIVKVGDDYRIQLLNVGVSNFDQTEVIDGLEEGQEVVYTFFSRAKQSSDEFKQRISSRMRTDSGLRSQ